MDTDSFLLHGVGVQSGLVHGAAIWMAPSINFRELSIELPVEKGAKDLYDRSVDGVASYLEDLSVRSAGESKAIIEAQVQIARDPALRKKVFSSLDKGVSLLEAISIASVEFKTLFSRLGGLYAERVSDLEDITNRLSAIIAGVDPPGLPQSDRPYILLADDLAPADTATLNPDKVMAILISKGGPTCHAAIIARALEIPTVVAVANLDKIVAGQSILVDGDEGSITVGISEIDAKEAISKRGVVSFNNLLIGPSKFRDSSPYNLLLNVGTNREIETVSPQLCDGVGLFRTEFLFLNRSSEPTVIEQRGYYSKLFEKFEGKSVIVRTIDAGADKPLPFLDLADEVNPALGVRGFRVVNLRREVIERQLEAISLAASEAKAVVSVMAPMISTVAEATHFVEMARSYSIPRAGVMVEVPAAVFCAEELLAVCDFVSIGTNDLAQYLFASDRESPNLVELQDPWNVALLRAIKMVANAGLRSGKSVSVCGEAASDPLFAAILIGLGVTSLSVGSASIGKLRGMISRCNRSELEALANDSTSITDPVSLKALTKSRLAALIGEA